MSREQFFKPPIQERPQAEEPAVTEKPADWEIIKAQHLAAKDAFHRARAEANRTGKERYMDKKYRKHTGSIDRPSM